MKTLEKERKNKPAYPKSAGRKDRRSATGVTGAPKKNGFGGKFTWSGYKDPIIEDAIEEHENEVQEEEEFRRF